MVLLRNMAVASPVAAYTDCAISATSASLVCTGGGFQPAWVGKSIFVAGAGDGGTILCTTISTYSSATTVTVATASVTSVTGATATVYNRDENITITGGKWSKAASSRTTTNALVLQHIDGLTIRDTTFANLGGNYSIFAQDVTNLTADTLTFASVIADGLHVTGPAKNVYIQNLRGVTNDDFVAIGADDGTYAPQLRGPISVVRAYSIYGQSPFNLVDVFGGQGLASVYDVEFHDLTPINCNGVKLDQGGGTSGNTTIGKVLIDGMVVNPGATAVGLGAKAGRDLIIQNVRFNFTASAILISGTSTTAWNSIRLHHITGTCSAGAPTLIDLQFPVSDLVSISDVDITGTGSCSSTGGVIGVSAAQNRVMVSNVVMDFSGSSGPLLPFETMANITNLQTSNIVLNYGTAANSNSFWFNGGTTTDWEGANINANFQGTGSGRFLEVDNSTTLSHYALSNVRQLNGNAVMEYSSGTTVGNGIWNSLTTSGVGRIANLYSDADLTFNGGDLGVGLQAIYAGAANVTVRGSGVNPIGGWTGFLLQVGTEVLHCINPDWPADITVLTQAVGDRCSNTNVSYQLGTLVSNGTHWYSYYSTLVL
jgi:hypothetical protein